MPEESRRGQCRLRASQRRSRSLSNRQARHCRPGSLDQTKTAARIVIPATVTMTARSRLYIMERQVPSIRRAATASALGTVTGPARTSLCAADARAAAASS